jgi:DnaJ-class molecular chaperone
MEETPVCPKCNGKGIIYGNDGSSRTCVDCLNSGKLTSFHHKFEQEVEDNSVCAKCHGTGIVKEASGQNHTCWDCLTSGRLDNHSKNVKDAGIKI